MGFGSGTGGLLSWVLSPKEVMFSLFFLGVQVPLPLVPTPILPSSWVSAAVTPVVVPPLHSPPCLALSSPCQGWGSGDAGRAGEQRGRWDGAHTSAGQPAAGVT